MCLVRRTAGVLGAITCVLAAVSARAQVDLISASTVHGVVDVRAEAADGEPSFTSDGFGKGRYGGDGSSVTGGVQLANATLEWTPRFGWDWTAVVDVIAQPGQEHTVDLDQAYLVFKPTPTSGTRFQARAGLFYPPVSLENDFRAWGVTNTITPSAIDSWIGEEVKVVGAEGKVTQDLGDQKLSATLGVFSYDDTAGTLLSFRGWAVHDIQSQANGSFDLPPRAPLLDHVQSDESYSLLDIDNRAGVYGRAEWKTPDNLGLSVFYYDNRGDMTSVTPDHQWAWATHFLDLGLRWDADEKTTILGQALEGRTVMGFQTPLGRFVDMDFRSAYLLATRLVGKSAFTGRLDLFDTHDNSGLALGDTNERGWALTGAWRYPLNQFLDVRLEALHIFSDRPGRLLADEAPDQSQTILQSSLRLSF